MSGLSTSPRILTIEDDAAIRRGIVDALQFAGYDVCQAACGAEGLQRALGNSFDLILLDLVLPDRSGLEILRQVRAVHPTLPVIILSARGDELDRVTDSTAVPTTTWSPFSVQELLRIEAVLRRSPQRPQSLTRVSFRGGQVDFERRLILLDDQTRESLSERECDLLLYLARHQGRAISREEILAHVWHLTPRGIHTRTIDMHVARIREKLRDDTTPPAILQTVRGKGYLFCLTDGPDPTGDQYSATDDDALPR